MLSEIGVHRWGTSQRFMNPNKVIMGGVNRDHGDVVPEFFRESVC
jgi:hypothetical protein